MRQQSARPFGWSLALFLPPFLKSVDQGHTHISQSFCSQGLLSVEVTEPTRGIGQNSSLLNILKSSYDMPTATSRPRMYGYIKNHKKTVKIEQARTRESEEAKESMPKPEKSSLSQIMVNSSKPLQDKTSQ
ncbi:hypothetical protein Tco_0694600 [Tanacetum coccineum]